MVPCVLSATLILQIPTKTDLVLCADTRRIVDGAHPGISTNPHKFAIINADCGFFLVNHVGPGYGEGKGQFVDFRESVASWFTTHPCGISITQSNNFPLYLQNLLSDFFEGIPAQYRPGISFDRSHNPEAYTRVGVFGRKDGAIIMQSLALFYARRDPVLVIAAVDRPITEMMAFGEPDVLIELRSGHLPAYEQYRQEPIVKTVIAALSRNAGSNPKPTL
jgi:hypothetical protein